MRTNFIFCLCVALSGCFKDDAKPVSYYLNNISEMQKKVDWCNDSEDRLNHTDCLNAISAKAKISISNSLAPLQIIDK